jgi:hypothetical protein
MYVRAKNIETYDKTILHYQEEMREEKNGRDLPVFAPAFRTFIVHDNDLGCSLADQDMNMSWYAPKSEEWSYKGDFELETKLTQREEFFLRHFISK